MTPTKAEENTTAVRRGHLVLEETVGATTNHRLDGDALLLVSSWESRCTEVRRVPSGIFPVTGVIRFAETGASGRRATHDAILDEHAQAHATCAVSFDRLGVRDLAGWREALTRFVAEIRSRLERPFDLVIDMTCLPKYYMLLLLGFAIKSAAVRSITLFYAEGRYASAAAPSPLATDHAFTQGEWRSFPVPFLEGQLSPDRKTRIIASIGFETFQARKFIRAYEAERHVLMTPNPGFAPEYESRSNDEALALANHLDVAPETMIGVPAGGAIEMGVAALDVVDSERRFNDVGLCLGTKPHALGLGFAAQLRPQLTLVCRMPDAYFEADTTALGRSWLYRVLDLSAEPR